MRRSFIFTLFLTCGLSQAQEPLSLERALELARLNRPSIKAAQLRIQGAQQAHRGLIAYPGARLLLGYSNDPAVGGTDDDFVISQPIDLFGRISAASQIGQAGVLRARAEYHQSLATLQAEIIELYSEAAAARLLAQNAVQTQGISQQLYDAVKALVDEGRVPGVQLTRVGIEVERAKLAANQRTAQYEAVRKRLTGLLNVSEAQVLIQDFPEIPDLQGGSQERRPDLRLLGADLVLAHAELQSAKAASRPELELQGRKTGWHESETRFGIRVQLNIPLFDSGRARSEERAARAKADAAQKEFDDASQVARAERAAARIELTASLEQIKHYEAILANAKKLVEISTVGFRERAITLIELLEGTRSLREVEDGYVEARLRLAKAQATYLKANGDLIGVGQ